MSDLVSWLFAVSVLFAAACVAGLAFEAWCRWFDRPAEPDPHLPLSHVRLLSDVDRWRSEISDEPSPWPLDDGWDAPGDAGPVSATCSPSAPVGLSGRSRTNVLARSTGKGTGQSTT